MADKDDKLPLNVPGQYYVDTTCIDCDLCRESSPATFTRDQDDGQTYVHKQPETEEERLQCEDALEACPVQAIGNDGA